jgi:hypothetical protein
VGHPFLEGKQEKVMTTMAANTFGFFQSKLKRINHQGHQSIDNYKGKHWCEGLVQNIFFGIDIALGNAETDDFTLRASRFCCCETK